MKIKLGSRHGQQGGVLLITLLGSMVIGVTLASYLIMVNTHNKSTMRSLAWNSAMAVVEAGIEEALTHINKRGMSNMVSDSWIEGSGVYAKTRVTSSDTKYTVTITTASPPIIISTGYVRLPMSTNFVSRTVRVTTRKDGLWTKGMVAKGQIDMSGNNIRTDSFDSEDPAYSTNGQYDPAKHKDNGDVATNSDLVDSLNVWNADLYGHVATGPGGTVKFGPNGTVGNTAWVDGGNHGIQPGWSTDDMNVSFPDVLPPFSGGAFTPVGGTASGTNYTYVLTGGNYQLSSLSMNGNNKMAVTGNAVLYVTGNISVSGNAFIYVATNASLKLYVGGSSASLAGNGVFNMNSMSTNFSYYGLPSNTSLSFSGNAAFTAAVYAPNAAFTLGGGGNNTYDFVGASVTSTVKLNGHFNFHYDEALGRRGPNRGFIITSWDEI